MLLGTIIIKDIGMADTVVENSVAYSQGIVPDSSSNYYSLFRFSIRSEVTRKYYERRIRHLLDFIEFEVDDVSIENRCNTFARKVLRKVRGTIHSKSTNKSDLSLCYIFDHIFKNSR